MSEAPDPFRRDPETRQFSIRRLLVLAVLCAVIGSVGQTLDLSLNEQVIFTFVWMAVAAYFVFRLPRAVLTLLGRTSRQKRLKAQRAELEEMTARKKREFRESQEDGDRDSSAG